MKKRFYRYFPWLFVLGDTLVLTFSVFFSNRLFKAYQDFNGLDFPAFPAFIMIWMVITVLKEDFKIGRTNEFEETFKKLLGSLAWFLVIISMIWLPFHDNALRLLSFLSLAASLFLFLGMYRVGVHLTLRKYRAQGYNFRRAVILGMGETSDQLAKVFRMRKDFGIKFLGYYDDEAHSGLSRGSIQSFFEEAKSLEVDQIYLSEHLEENKVKEIINFADDNYIKVKVIPGGRLQLEKNLSFSKFGDFFVINVNEIPLDNAFNRVFKRGFDVVFSLFVIVFILSWLIPLVGLLIKLESRGPVFFIQDRNGENNRIFRCLKFRSMTPNDYSDTHQATKNDPRITRIGSFLRMTSLDEMPQFINVLFGEMSIVGPRPHTVPMNIEFKTQIEKYNSRHKIKPGITGLAQVKGYRGEIEKPHQIRARVKLDSFYIQNWSFLLDLKICTMTVYELVVNRENAY